MATQLLQLSTLSLIDTHAHPRLSGFRSGLRRRAARAPTEAGVTRIITIGTSLEQQPARGRAGGKIFERFRSHRCSSQLALEDAPDDVITPLRELAKSPRVAAIGETGLDYHHLPSAVVARGTQDAGDFRRFASRDRRRDRRRNPRWRAARANRRACFQQQLDLAVELKLNVVIHQRDAWDDTLETRAITAGR